MVAVEVLCKHEKAGRKGWVILKGAGPLDWPP